MLDSSWFKVCAFFQSSGRLLPCWSASSYHGLVSLKPRLVFSHLEVSSPYHSSLGCLTTLLTKHSPSHIVHQTLSVSLYYFIYIMLCIWLSALQICLRIATKYKYCLLLVLLFWCEDRTDTGKDLALGELGEETKWSKVGKRNFFRVVWLGKF